MPRTMGFEYALFETPLGRCGIAWSKQGIRRFQLPEVSSKETERRLLAGLESPARADPPAWVRQVLGRVEQHLSGAPQDFADVRLDLDGVPPFHRRVYEAALAAGPGRTLTYGEMAERAGSPGASRAVGQALARNPIPLLVPCHRVLAAGNRPGGFSAFGGASTKARLLALEGVALPVKDVGEPLPYDGGAAVLLLAAADPTLGRLMAVVGPLRLTLSPTRPFDALAHSIVYQQLNGRAAATIFERVRALFPGKRLAPQALLELSDETLRGAGLSGAKTAAMKDLARKTLEGVVPGRAALVKLTNEEIIERLTTIRGVGQWTVEMMLMFRLGRPDVLPVDDYGVRKGFAVTYGGELPNRKALAEHGERWKPFRTVASWYMWRAAELPDEVKATLARPAGKRPGARAG